MHNRINILSTTNQYSEFSGNMFHLIELSTIIGGVTFIEKNSYKVSVNDSEYRLLLKYSKIIRI